MLVEILVSLDGLQKANPLRPAQNQRGYTVNKHAIKTIQRFNWNSMGIPLKGA
jgi:hypothetical protein